jgi:flavin-dependent dehydrogenase
VPDDGGHHVSDRVVSYDVLIVGAGPAGCAAAATLARAGREVVVLDAGGPAFHVGEGAAPGAGRLVEEIFGPGAFTLDAHLPCPSIVSAWGSEEPGVVEHVLNPLGHAWNLDRERFDAELRAGAARLGAELRSGRYPLDAPPARLVIDASGRGARFARRQGARTRHLDRLVSLWAVWTAEHDQDARLYLEAVEHGWWYSVLLPGGRRMVMYLTDADLLPDDRGGLAESARGLDLIGPLLRGHIVTGPGVCSARTSRLEPFAGDGWLAAGDAACAFDPLSGRGIVAALLTGRSAGLAADTLLSGSSADCEELLSTLFADTLAERAETYAAETRWPELPFWARRRSSVLA